MGIGKILNISSYSRQLPRQCNRARAIDSIGCIEIISVNNRTTTITPTGELVAGAEGTGKVISATGNTHSLPVSSAGAVKGNGAGTARSAESDRLVDVAAAVGGGNGSVGSTHSEGDAGAGGGVERAGTTRP